MRHQDWSKRFNSLIQAASNKPFVWGKHDCCLFAADVVYELTGVDHAQFLRGRYKTHLGAARIIKKLGGVKVIVENALGDEIQPLLAQRGDIVLIKTKEFGDTLAVCAGEYCFAPGYNGLAKVSIQEAVAAWRVA